MNHDVHCTLYYATCVRKRENLKKTYWTRVVPERCWCRWNAFGSSWTCGNTKKTCRKRSAAASSASAAAAPTNSSWSWAFYRRSRRKNESGYIIWRVRRKKPSCKRPRLSRRTSAWLQSLNGDDDDDNNNSIAAIFFEPETVIDRIPWAGRLSPYGGVYCCVRGRACACACVRDVFRGDDYNHGNEPFTTTAQSPLLPALGRRCRWWCVQLRRRRHRPGSRWFRFDDGTRSRPTAARAYASTCPGVVCRYTPVWGSRVIFYSNNIHRR